MPNTDIELIRKQIEYRNGLVLAMLRLLMQHTRAITLRVDCTSSGKKLWDYPKQIPLKVSLDKGNKVSTYMHLNLPKVRSIHYGSEKINIRYMRGGQQHKLLIPYTHITGVAPLEFNDNILDESGLDNYAFSIFSKVPHELVELAGKVHIQI